ncbi:hypothetical protein ACFQH6_04650 [Halobacteriaceae archaeon GCM10025711]
MVDLIDVVLEGFKDIVEWVIGLFEKGLWSGYNQIKESMFGTPTPITDGPFVFGEPTNAPWGAIEDSLVGGEVMLVALLLLVMTVQGRHTVRIFNVGSAYEARKARKTAWLGAVLIITWYWVGVLILYLVEGFTLALIPDLSTLSNAMLDFMNVAVANPALALSLASVGGIAMWTLQALYYLREVLLYVYMFGMPFAIALAYGNLPVVSDIAMRFAKRFVPLAVLPMPAAILFKGYDLLYGNGSALNPSTAFLQYLVAVSLPVLALVVTWKTFTYASPLTTRVLGAASRGAVTVGAVATGAYVAGPAVASTAARWGPKAATGHALAQKLGTNQSSNSENAQSPGTRTADNVATDEHGGVPEYRRSENDPSYY